MFGIRKTRTSSRRAAVPQLRTRLGCEQLGDRINPTTIGDFTGTATGMFTYDETQVNPDLPTQTLILSDMQFTYTGLHFVADSAPVAHLAYGHFVSLDSFTASCDSNPQVPDVTISVDGNVVTYTVNGQSSQGTGSVDIKPQGWVTMDFTNFKIPPQGVANKDTLTITVTCGNQPYPITVPIAAGLTPAGTAAAVKAALEDNGFTNVTINNGTVVTLKGPGPNGRAISGFSLTHDTNSGNPTPVVTHSDF